jgi:hypothetical protein
MVGDIIADSRATSPGIRNVSRDQLLTAIEQVELLGDWLEDRMFAAKYPSRPA